VERQHWIAYLLSRGNLAPILYHTATSHVERDFLVVTLAHRFVTWATAEYVYSRCPSLADVVAIASMLFVIRARKSHHTAFGSVKQRSTVVDMSVVRDAAPENARLLSVKLQSASSNHLALLQDSSMTVSRLSISAQKSVVEVSSVAIILVQISATKDLVTRAKKLFSKISAATVGERSCRPRFPAERSHHLAHFLVIGPKPVVILKLPIIVMLTMSLVQTVHSLPKNLVFVAKRH
jgi:hypothetical protein